MFADTQTRSFKIRTEARDIVTAKYISLPFESRFLGDGYVVCDILYEMTSNSLKEKEEWRNCPEIVLHISITMSDGDNMPTSTDSQEVQESLDLIIFWKWKLIKQIFLW